MSDAQDRAEKLWLNGESLERQLIAQGANPEVLSSVADVVVAARELYDALTAVNVFGSAAASVPPAPEKPEAEGHVVRCDHCARTVTLPRTADGRRLSLTPLTAGWYFADDVGWCCPDHAPKKPDVAVSAGGGETGDER